MFKKAFSKEKFRIAQKRMQLNLKGIAGFLILWLMLGFFGRSVLKYHYVMTYGEKTWTEIDEQKASLSILTGPACFWGSIIGIVVQDDPKWGMSFDFKCEKILTFEEAKKLKQQKQQNPEKNLKKKFKEPKKGKSKKDFGLVTC